MSAERNHIRTRRVGHVAVLTIDRPPFNHVSVELVHDLADEMEALDLQVDCRALVIAAAGKVFCGGADLNTPRDDGADPSTIAGGLYDEAERLFRTRKPIVACVQGAAVGAGLGLALVADFRVAAKEARFSANFAKIGFHSGFGISLTLPRLVGRQAASLMLQTGRRLTGEEALQIGLADQLAPLPDLEAAAIGLAEEISENAPLAVQAMRATLRKGLADEVRDQMSHELAQQGVQRQSKDYAEGVKAVAERRPGRFVGA